MPYPNRREIVTRDNGVQYIGKGKRWYRYGPGPWCGTHTGYSAHGCRCDDCRKAHSEDGAKRRASEGHRYNKRLLEKRYREKLKKERHFKMHTAVATLNGVFKILDQVALGEISAEEAVKTVIRKYG